MGVEGLGVCGFGGLGVSGSEFGPFLVGFCSSPGREANEN